MKNVTGVLNYVRDTAVPDLLSHDVTILAIRIERDEKSDHARYVIQCKMDEWFVTWANGYYHSREKFTADFDKVFVPFLVGEVFALIDLEDV